MKLDSEYFDRIRVGRKGTRRGASPKPATPECAWEGCREPGLHKAPLGRDYEGQYLFFCVDHVRQYNKSYNYFSGLADDDIEKYVKDSLTGHRPTWQMGRNGSVAGDAERAASLRRARRWKGRTGDPFDLFGPDDVDAAPVPRRPKVRSLEAKAFETLDLSTSTPPADVRVRYKMLVKRLHPDANGGDRGTEDKLREVIQAYKLLKQSGFC